MGQAISLSCASGGRTVLYAAANGESESVREILSDRPDLIEATYNGGQNVAHVAAGNGDRECLQAVLDAFSSGNSSPQSSSYDLKLQAMRDIGMVRQLKDALNAQNGAGLTPMMLAAQNGHVSCVRFLLDNGADIFKVDKTYRRTVIHYAASSGQHRVLKYLLNDSTLMHTDEGVQALRAIRIMDISGQCRYIDSRAENGLTALHLAAVKGELSCVKVLLNAGASMMVRTVDLEMASPHSVPNGSTPLHLAAQKGSVPIVQAMLQAHADAMGDWAGEGSGTEGRRNWEQSNRIDLRSVANQLRQLPYHVAWQRGYRQTATILNPTIPIDIALENVRELDEGFGAQKLTTLAAYALRKNLLTWLEQAKGTIERASREREQRETSKKIIAQQKRKEALKFHSQMSVDQSLSQSDALFSLSSRDQGHAFAPSSNLGSLPARDDSDPADVLATIQSMDPGTSRESSVHASSSQNLTSSVLTSLPQVQPESAPEPSGDSATTRRKLNNAKIVLKTSMRKLVPTRVAPPPPPPSSESTEARPQGTPPRPVRHRRGVSWERGAPVEAEPAEEMRVQNSPPADISCLASPFRSPFEQASITPVAVDSDAESLDDGARRSMSMHPSGVCLVDPPDVDGVEGLVRQTSLARSGVLGAKSRKSLGGLGSFTGVIRSFSKPGAQAPGKIMTRAASIPGFEHNLDCDEDCGICLEDPVNVAINGCCHKLCVNCALKMCQVNKKPPLCPFCRDTINGFHQC